MITQQLSSTEVTLMLIIGALFTHLELLLERITSAKMVDVLVFS